MFTVTGLFYSIRTIQTNWTRYLTYPSSIKPAYDANEAIKFPKGFQEYFEYDLKIISVTICPNGQHSMALIDKMYPELDDVDLGFVYTGVGRQVKENKTVRKDLKK